MANRYTRLTPSTFNPLSLQEIFTVPLARQKQHDETVAQIDKLGLFDIKSLDQDKDTANNYINKYQGQLEGLSDKIMERGIDSLSKREVMKLAKERDEWLKRGEGSKIVSNYNAYKTNADSLKKLYEDGDISRDKYLLGLNKAKSSYKGVGEGDTYTPFSAVKDTEYMTKASDIAQAISDNPKTIEGFTDLVYDENTGKYVDITTEQEYTQEGAIKLAIKAGLAMDTNVISDLNQRKQLGMLGKLSVSDYIDSIATQNEFIYAKNNAKQSRQFVGVDAEQRAAQANEGAVIDPSYILGNNVTVEQKYQGLSDTLNRLDSKLGQMYNAGALSSRALGDTGLAGGTSALLQLMPDLQMTPTEQMQFNRITSGLRKTGVITEGTTPEDEIKIIQKYLNDHSNLEFQPVKYTNGLYKEYSNQGSKVKQSTPEDLAKSFALNPENFMIIDQASGGVRTFDMLSPDDQSYITEGKAKVSGVYGPRNFLADKYPSILSENLVSPMEIQLEGNKKLLISRPTSEKNNVGHVAAESTNDIWRNISYPNLPYDTQLPGLGEVSITRKVSTDPSTGYLLKNSIQIELEGGKTYTLNDDGHLEEFINKLYFSTYGTK